MLQEMFREILPFVSLTYECGSATWYKGKIYQHINSFERVRILDRSCKEQVGNLNTSRDGRSGFVVYSLSVVFYGHVGYRNSVFSIGVEVIIRIDPSLMSVSRADDIVGQNSLQRNRAHRSLRVSKNLFASYDLIGPRSSLGK